MTTKKVKNIYIDDDNNWTIPTFELEDGTIKKPIYWNNELIWLSDDERCKRKSSNDSNKIKWWQFWK